MGLEYPRGNEKLFANRWLANGGVSKRNSAYGNNYARWKKWRVIRIGSNKIIKAPRGWLSGEFYESINSPAAEYDAITIDLLEIRWINK